MTDVDGEPPPGLRAIERRRFEKADDLGVRLHRGERLEVLGGERDEVEAGGVEHRGVRSMDSGARWAAGRRGPGRRAGQAGARASGARCPPNQDAP